MNKFKVDHFGRENTGKRCPDYTSLSNDECDEIRVKVCEALGVPTNVTRAALVTRLAISQQACGINAESDGFDLKEFTTSVGIVVQRDAFINFHQFDKIDRIAFADLASHFLDIWYPSSDDIDIFDRSFSWFISITHFGQVRVLRL